MTKYTVRFGECICYNVEADSKMEAIEKARKTIHPQGIAHEEEITTIGEMLRK